MCRLLKAPLLGSAFVLHSVFCNPGSLYVCCFIVVVPNWWSITYDAFRCVMGKCFRTRPCSCRFISSIVSGVSIAWRLWQNVDVQVCILSFVGWTNCTDALIEHLLCTLRLQHIGWSSCLFGCYGRLFTLYGFMFVFFTLLGEPTGQML